ncbi:anthrone oxygenase family protein [Kytococcus sedentarius]|uniref:anthrone oxygenase family protein n=1 Tax=Kytococcus sedentarius TaxID=1276 RepID=UPI00384C800C
MSSSLLPASTLLTGLLAGFWATWGVVVLPALDRVPPAVAAASMRSLNEAVLTPAFLVPFAAAPLVTAGAAGALALEGARPAAAWAALSVLVQLVGVVAVTRGVNVPLNEQLARSVADPAEAWAAFSGPWQRANAVRALAGLAATGCCLAAGWLR